MRPERLPAAQARGGRPGGPSGGVATSVKPARDSSFFGTGLPPLASDLLLVLLLVIGMAAGVLLVVADSVGLGPRHQRWRRSAVDRTRARVEGAPGAVRSAGRRLRNRGVHVR